MGKDKMSQEEIERLLRENDDDYDDDYDGYEEGEEGEDDDEEGTDGKDTEKSMAGVSVVDYLSEHVPEALDAGPALMALAISLDKSLGELGTKISELSKAFNENQGAVEKHANVMAKAFSDAFAEQADLAKSLDAVQAGMEDLGVVSTRPSDAAPAGNAGSLVLSKSGAGNKGGNRNVAGVFEKALSKGLIDGQQFTMAEISNWQVPEPFVVALAKSLDEMGDE